MGNVAGYQPTLLLKSVLETGHWYSNRVSQGTKKSEFGWMSSNFRIKRMIWQTGSPITLAKQPSILATGFNSGCWMA